MKVHKIGQVFVCKRYNIKDDDDEYYFLYSRRKTDKTYEYKVKFYYFSSYGLTESEIVHNLAGINRLLKTAIKVITKDEFDVIMAKYLLEH